jgi:hypothetical protein
MKSNHLVILLFCLAIIGIPILINTKINYDKDKIEWWAKRNHYKIIDTEWHMTTIGSPFYYVHKNCYIYEVDLITPDGKTEHWWVRNNPISKDDYVKE